MPTGKTTFITEPEFPFEGTSVAPSEESQLSLNFATDFNSESSIYMPSTHEAEEIYDSPHKNIVAPIAR